MKNGYIKLIGAGWQDIRTGEIYSDVICKVEDEQYFVKV